MCLGGEVLVVLGPTASGKTGLGIALARRLNGEIVSADSRQIYRLMDIGTAKPTPEQRAAAPHHLLDVVNPDEDFSLSDFIAHARRAIDDIHARGKVALLVGGTGQYITALLDGWSIPPVPPNETLRAELEAEAAAHGAADLHDRLRALDPASADAIHPHNIRRVVRALEVCLTTGQRFSDLQRKQPPPYTVRYIGLTLERDALYARADQRFDDMIAAGFVDEVRGLLAAGYDRRLPSMSGLGYAELCAHLLDGEPLVDAIARAKGNTHDFIRRQYTWFRGHDRGIRWYDGTEGVDVDEIVDLILST
jgi:tRNA dimethylallyltransferase